MPHTHDLLVSTGQPYQQSYTTIRALFCPSSPLCLGVFLVDHPILRGISEIMETYVYFFDRFPNIYYETKIIYGVSLCWAITFHVHLSHFWDTYLNIYSMVELFGKSTFPSVGHNKQCKWNFVDPFPASFLFLFCCK